MISSLKKNSDKESAATAPAWHPNFRNYERLPDIKVVRTTFFVNGVAALVAVALCIYTIYGEVELSSLKSETVTAEGVVAANKPLSDQAVVLYKKFQVEEKKIDELKQFLDVSTLTLSDFLLKLGADILPAIKLSSVDYKSGSVTLRGNIKGSSEEGTILAIGYVDKIRASEFYANRFDPIALTSLARDPGTGEMRFEIGLTFKSSAKPSLGAKK